ncbi:hypothetical protein Bca4012_103034 [Brassica carinata]
MTNCANQRFLVLGRADIEGSKSSVAMSGLAATSQLSLWTPALSFNRCAPQPNSPPDNVLRRIDREASLGSKEGLLPASDSRIGFPLSVPVLSWLFGAGKLERAVPSPSPADEAVALATLAAQAAANSRRVGTGTPSPALEPILFRNYGSILPTSLAYIVPSTRGCSPWRPDAVMSATGRGGFRSSVFKGAGMHGHHAACGALPAAGPYLG